MANSSPSWWSKDTVAVVTGANKGIGYETVRLLGAQGLTVVLTARDPGRGQAAVDALKAAGLESIWFHPLDLVSSDSAENLAKWLKTKFGGIDILVNNAGVNAGRTGAAVTPDNVEDVLATNYYGTKKVTEALLPLLRSSPAGSRIVNVTSRLGLFERFRSEKLKQKFRNENDYSVELADSLAANYLADVKAGCLDEGGWIADDPSKVPMYSESKIFLNVYGVALAKAFQSQPEDRKIFLATFCPGVTQTDLFGSAASLGFDPPAAFPLKTPAEGADTGVWLALLPKEQFAEKTGKFFGEREEYPFSLENPPI